MKNKKLLLLLLFIIICALFFIILDYNKNKQHMPQNVVSLENAVKNIDNIQKNIMFQSEQGLETKITNNAQKSLEAWQFFVDTYKYNQPEEYKKTRDWSKKLLIILEHEKKAQELILEGKILNAKEEQRLSREIYKEIKEENGILDITDEMLAFHDAAEKIIAAKTKTEIIKFLPDLKYKFTILKEYNIDKNYNKLIVELEKNIAGLDKLLDGPDFQKAQKILEPLFLELYMKY